MLINQIVYFLDPHVLYCTVPYCTACSVCVVLRGFLVGCFGAAVARRLPLDVQHMKEGLLSMVRNQDAQGDSR